MSMITHRLISAGTATSKKAAMISPLRLTTSAHGLHSPSSLAVRSFSTKLMGATPLTDKTNTAQATVKHIAETAASAAHGPLSPNLPVTPNSFGAKIPCPYLAGKQLFGGLSHVALAFAPFIEVPSKLFHGPLNLVPGGNVLCPYMNGKKQLLEAANGTADSNITQKGF